MIKIDVDGNNLFYPANVDAFPVINPTLSVELNKAGSASFTLPPKHPLYNSINKLKSKITVWDQNSVLWRGRCLNYEDDAAKNRTFLMEGQMAYLNDAIIRPYTYTGTVRGLLVKLINEYNEQVDEWKQISVGTVTVTSPEGDTIKRKSTAYTTAWDEITSQLVNVLGGYLIPAYNTTGGMTLSYREEPGELGTQDIRFGQNILDLARYVSAENIYTVLIPTGKSISEATSDTTTSRSGANVTIESVNGGLDYIQNNAAVNLFGKIWREKNWSYISSPSELKAVAQAELAKNIAESITINIDAIDLHTLNVNTQAIKLGSLHNVIAPYYNLNAQFYCSKIDYNFNSPKDNRYTFGTLQQSLTELQREEEMQTDSDISNASEGINDRIDGTEGNLTNEAETREAMDDAILALIGAEGVVPEGMTVLQYAQEEATKLITEGVPGGYVFIDHNQILIMNTDDIDTATSIWQWTSGGLGWRAGKNAASQVAMYVNPQTGKGCITGDMITAGKVLAEYIALFGQMAVYRSNVISDTNVGGYLGYYAGSDGTSDTEGMAMTSTNGNKIAVSSNGASINGGTPFFSVANRCQCGGNMTITGNLNVNMDLSVTGAASFVGDVSINGVGNVKTKIDAINKQINNLWDALDGKADKNHSHSS